MNSKTQITFEKLIQKLNSYLTKNPKLRKSHRREQILRVLYESGQHLTPDEIFKEIRARYDSKTSISTVYRALLLFEDAHLIKTIAISKDVNRYEIDYDSHHDHLICLQCGRIIEFKNDAIEALQAQVCEEHDFKLLDHTMALMGICSYCQKK
jgi:Fur family ferric uptake transcriptional regulator